MSDAASNLQDDPAAEALLRASIDRAAAAGAQIDVRQEAFEAGLEVLREGSEAADRIAAEYRDWIMAGHVIRSRFIGSVLATPAGLDQIVAKTGLRADAFPQLLGDNDEGQRYADALLMQAKS